MKDDGVGEARCEGEAEEKLGEPAVRSGEQWPHCGLPVPWAPVLPGPCLLHTDTASCERAASWPPHAQDMCGGGGRVVGYFPYCSGSMKSGEWG